MSLFRSPYYDFPTSRDVQLSHRAFAAGGGTDTLVVWRSPCRALLTGVDWIPLVAVTGTNTDTVSLRVIDKGTDGNGANSLSLTDFVAGTNAADLTALVLYEPDAGDELQMSEGTAIVCNGEQTANGLALPGGTFVFTYEPN